MSESNSPHDIRETEERLRFETLLAELSARFINLPAAQVDTVIEDAQRRICECLGLDRSSLWQFEEDNSWVFILSHVYSRPGSLLPPSRMCATEYFPWTIRQMQARMSVVLSSLADLPREADRDRESYRQFDTKSTVVVPLSAGGGPTFGAISFAIVTAERTWTKPLIKRFELVAQVFANAIVRKRAEQALRESEQRLSMALDASGVGAWSMDVRSRDVWVSAGERDLLGCPAGEYLIYDSFLEAIHPDDRENVQAAVEKTIRTKVPLSAEYRLARSDGSVRWISARGNLRCEAGGGAVHLMGISVDITQRKQAEDDLRRALDEVKRLRDRLQLENVYLREQVLGESGHTTIVGKSDPVKRMLALARKVGPENSTVLITGETGTGKELLAQEIHDLSPRKAKTMVKVNCAALPAPLIESELFGREKGAYTGAMTRQVGRFEVADGSTIFLDEIGDLPPDLQAKLLRVLQDGQYERLGSNRTLTADVRVIAATNHDLGAMVRGGRFREDLFHRLSVFPIEVPPLRARGADIPLLAWKFVQDFNTKMGKTIDSIPGQAMDRLKQYPWPGNVRELRNLIERAMILSEGCSLRIELPASRASSADPPDTLEELERGHILSVLERVRWRISGNGGAAAILGLPATTLHSRMKKLGITRPGR